MILIVLIILIFLFFTNVIEMYSNLRSTRNMSYDIRGEAYYPDFIEFPFNNSELRIKK
jgi:hypothetical protein